jgi:hypothetical protein
MKVEMINVLLTFDTTDLPLNCIQVTCQSQLNFYCLKNLVFILATLAIIK